MAKQEPIGQRHSKQRDAIHHAIEHASGPLLPDEIHKRAKTAVPNLGIATVYRTINLLLENELIQPVTLPDGNTRYESADLGHHHHFRCRQCGKVYDLPGCMLKIDDGAQLPGGFKVESHEVTLVGVCPACGDAA